jgi:glycosyltransferase involved in cell wall biosynthesis
MIVENTPDKVLVGTAVIDRPETTERFFNFFIEHSDLNRFYWIVVDNNSNAETKAILQKYRQYYQVLIENPFNTGVAFSINQCLAHRLPGQHYLNTNVDSWIMTHDWLDIMLHFVNKTWT